MMVMIMEMCLVKAREGRPIWVKGNKDFGLTRGGITPRIGASVLNLYNSDRLRGPSKRWFFGFLDGC